jgi:hypothetical protein
LAAQQMMATQQKHAQMFKGGAPSGFQAPNMGGNNPQQQEIANKLTAGMASQQSLAVNDARYKVGGGMKKCSCKICCRNKRRKSKKNIKRNKHKSKRRYK